MNGEIIAIGTELLLGDTINTNAAYLAKELSLLGIYSYYQTVVGDNAQRLKEALKLAFSRSDLVITTGGLGPTYDDITKEVVAEYFDTPLELSLESLQRMERHFSSTSIPPSNRKQAMMPQGATIFPNYNGTADGLALEKEGKIVILLPGPPYELIPMFQQGVIPYLKTFQQGALVSQTLHLFGIGESQLEQELREMMEDYQNPTIAPYAQQGEVALRVTASGKTKEEGERLVQPVVRKLAEEYQEYVYTTTGENLETELVQKLAALGKKIATAESCTGGLVSQRITSVSGSSQVFDLGVTSYSNEMKMELLHVSSETLERYGAVSSETALEMARGVRQLAGADLGVSTTGIAGPTGGTPEKPVGLVYVAVSWEGGEVVKQLHLDRGYQNGRDRIRWMASSHALFLALRHLIQ